MDTLTILIISLVCLVILYIVAKVFSNKTECVILYKWYDFAALVWIGFLPLLLAILSKIDGVQDHLITLGIVALAIPFIVFIITSIVPNLGNGKKTILFIIVSLLGKLPFILLSFIIAFGLFLIYRAGSDAVKDGRYRDGTKGNKKTKSKRRALAFFFFIFTPLVISMVKPSLFQDSIKKYIHDKTVD